MFAIEQFNIPVPPDMVFPRVPQIAAELTLWLVVASFVIYAVREWCRAGSPLGLALFAVGWPIYSALNAQAGPVITWGTALLAIVLGLAILDMLISTAARLSARLRITELQEAIA